MSIQPSLLTTLFRWSHRQGENFLTDSFAYILRHLLADEHHVAEQLLAPLTNGLITASSNRQQAVAAAFSVN